MPPYDRFYLALGWAWHYRYFDMNKELDEAEKIGKGKEDRTLGR